MRNLNGVGSLVLRHGTLTVFTGLLQPFIGRHRAPFYRTGLFRCLPFDVDLLNFKPFENILLIIILDGVVVLDQGFGLFRTSYLCKYYEMLDNS